MPVVTLALRRGRGQKSENTRYRNDLWSLMTFAVHNTADFCVAFNPGRCVTEIIDNIDKNVINILIPLMIPFQFDDLLIFDN